MIRFIALALVVGLSLPFFRQTNGLEYREGDNSFVRAPSAEFQTKLPGHIHLFLGGKLVSGDPVARRLAKWWVFLLIFILIAGGWGAKNGGLLLWLFRKK